RADRRAPRDVGVAGVASRTARPGAALRPRRLPRAPRRRARDHVALGHRPGDRRARRARGPRDQGDRGQRMKVGGSHLTYCTNIHPGESWLEVQANLERYTLAVRQRVAFDKPFGVGLRLSARAAQELATPRELATLRAWLDLHGLYVFT